MKKVLIPTLILFVQCSTTSGTELTQEDRDFAINELRNSRDNLLSSINDLSETQLNYKIDESSWSIAQCTEHITLLENVIFEVLEESLELPANPDLRKSLSYTDKELMVHISNRTTKAITSEDLQPHGKYGNQSSTVKEFKAKRQKHIDYIKTTKDDLRNHFTMFTKIDAFQAILYMSSHINRHIKQINEILNNKNFPSN